MKMWPEYESGEGYTVQLKSLETEEMVEVGYVEEEEDGEYPNYVYVRSTMGKALFERVLGVVTYALAQNSDDLTIFRQC
tara:strand:- start:1191 stop:1427 length:237 start_codon:yes stop_codon:yes gene_type:complete